MEFASGCSASLERNCGNSSFTNGNADRALPTGFALRCSRLPGVIPEPILQLTQGGLVALGLWHAFIGSQMLLRRSSARYRKGTGYPPKRHLRGDSLRNPSGEMLLGFFLLRALSFRAKSRNPRVSVERHGDVSTQPVLSEVEGLDRTEAACEGKHRMTRA